MEDDGEKAVYLYLLYFTFSENPKSNNFYYPSGSGSGSVSFWWTWTWEERERKRESIHSSVKKWNYRNRTYTMTTAIIVKVVFFFNANLNIISEPCLGKSVPQKLTYRKGRHRQRQIFYISLPSQSESAWKIQTQSSREREKMIKNNSNRPTLSPFRLFSFSLV